MLCLSEKMDFLLHLGTDLNMAFAVIVLTMFLLFHYWYRLPKNFPPCRRGIPLIGVAPFIGRYFERSLKEWSKIYGPVMSFRLGRIDVVVLNDYESIVEAFVKRKEQFSGRPGYKAMDLFDDKGYGIVLADYGPFWKSQRKFGLTTLRGFGVGKKSMEEKVMEEVCYLNKQIQRHEGKPFDILKPLTNAVSNNICSVLFGNRFDYDDPKFTTAANMFSRGMGDPETSATLGALLLIPILGYIPPFSTKMKRMRKDFAWTEGMIQDIIKEHKESLDIENPRDFIDAFFVEMKKTDDSSFTEHQLLKFCHNLFFAGTETTTSTLRWAILCLLHFPEAQKKLHKEITEAIGTNSAVSMSDRTKMPYTCAFIEELYRFRTLLPLSITHKTTEDVIFRGYFIPKNTMVWSNLWAVHNDPKIWKEPEKFEPERHLDSNGNFTKSNYVIPFSVGLRHCLGKQLARMEVFIFLVSLLQKFEFQPSPNDDKLPEINEANNAGIFIPLDFDVVAKEI